MVQKTLGLTQAEFARLADLSPATVWRAANLRPIGAPTVRRIYKAVRNLPQLPPEVLNGYEPEQTPVEGDKLDGYMVSVVKEGRTRPT